MINEQKKRKVITQFDKEIKGLTKRIERMREERKEGRILINQFLRPRGITAKRERFIKKMQVKGIVKTIQNDIQGK